MHEWRKTMGARAGSGVAGTALAITLLVGSAPQALAQTPEGEIVSNCVFSDVQIAGLKQAIATALGLPNTTRVATPIVIVPSFNENLGQPNAQGGNAPFTGIVLCRSETEAGPLQSVSESADFPSSGTADVLEVQQSSYVLIEAGTGRSLRICHTDQVNDCFVTTE